MQSWAFLWITDLHFADPVANFDDDPKALDEVRDQELRNSIVDDFHQLLDFDFRRMADSAQDGSPPPLSFIAVGGDITTRGHPQGFEKFKESTFQRLRNFVEDSKAICVVPGNHDVVWHLNPTQSGYFTRKFAPFTELIRVLGLTSCFIPKGQLDATQLYQEKRLEFDLPSGSPIYVDTDNKVVLLTINSSIRCGELDLKLARQVDDIRASPRDPDKINIDDFPDGMRSHLTRDVAHVTQTQLANLNKRLETERNRIEDWDSYLRVALTHHHLAPFPGQVLEHKGYEATVDSAAVLRFLARNEFDVVLTGHKHQPYASRYRFDDREILLLGGATVAGAAPNESFRGFHFVQVVPNQRGREIKIFDIPHTLARAGNLEVALREIKPKSFVIPSNSLAATVKKQGFFYREIVSITRINDDGDAHRFVECDGLLIQREGKRQTSHSIDLPPTSGYLDLLQPSKGSNLQVYKRVDIPPGQNSKSARVELGFHPHLRVAQGNQKDGISYGYEWYAVNAFALDELQYERKYGISAADPLNIEFTHYVPVDPIERLTVIVQLPKKMTLPHLPTLRIMKVGDDQNDSRTWIEDKEERDHLEDIRAFRFFKPLNIAALRVRTPKRGLSYGIQWSLPPAPQRGPQDALKHLIHQLTTQSDDTLRRIYRILRVSREFLLNDWDKDLDGTLMLFTLEDCPGCLKTVSAGITPGRPPDRKPIDRLSNEAEVTLNYGEGIAGRAFKANAIRIYQDPQIAGQQLKGDAPPEPNFYKKIDGILPHKVLIAFPVHLPVEEFDPKHDPNVYEKREPYGVLNIGSTFEKCPISKFLQPSRAPDLLPFQHQINNILAEGN